jgi:hypothetical protein
MPQEFLRINAVFKGFAPINQHHRNFLSILLQKSRVRGNVYFLQKERVRRLQLLQKAFGFGAQVTVRFAEYFHERYEIVSHGLSPQSFDSVGKYLRLTTDYGTVLVLPKYSNERE